MGILYWIILILGTVLLGTLTFIFLKKKEREHVSESLNMTLFCVTMPKYKEKSEEKDQKDEKMLIGQMEQVFTNFLYLKKPGFWKRNIYGSPKIVLEIASHIGGTDISFYVAVPKHLETAFEKYVQGVYSRALVEKMPQDYTIFEPGGATAGCYLRLAEPDIFPINTYKNLEKDPLASVTNALSKIAPEEGVAIQIVIRPSQFNFQKRGNKILRKIKEGKKVGVAISEVSRSPIVEILMEMIRLFTSNKSAEEKTETGRAKIEPNVDENVIKNIQEKIQKPIFETNIRFIASAPKTERAEQILNDIKGSFGQFSLSLSNSFIPREAKGGQLKKLVYDFSFRNFNPSQKISLNIEELASIYHFPTYYTETPNVKLSKTGSVAPPSELPEKGVSLIGKVTFRGEEKNVYFANRKDRRRHFYAIGQTGTGKSSLLREMIRQDIQNGEGVAVIDPHGDLIEDTLANIPKERIKDVILFEPSDTGRPVGLNMLEFKSDSQKDFAVQEMIAIFHKLFPPEIVGPMFEHYMRNAMLALMSDKNNPGTLVEIPRMFTDDVFMEQQLEKVTDPIVRSFWLKEWKQTTGSTKSDMLGYVVSKIGRFIGNEMMRNIIGQPFSGFDLEDIMNEGKIFLANLSKGLTGETNASLLGLILVSKMQMAIMRRAEIPEAQRKDFYLYIDEFQNFTTDSIATILSEARKYRLNLILAHQYMPQLKEEIRDAVLGNVGSIGAFRVGAADAEFLEKQFEPDFSRFDLTNIDNFNFIVKMMIDGKTSKPFKVEALFPKKGNIKRVQLIKKRSRDKYGRLKILVEEEILERSKLNNI